MCGLWMLDIQLFLNTCTPSLLPFHQFIPTFSFTFFKKLLLHMYLHVYMYNSLLCNSHSIIIRTITVDSDHLQVVHYNYIIHSTHIKCGETRVLTCQSHAGKLMQRNGSWDRPWECQLLSPARQACLDPETQLQQTHPDMPPPCQLLCWDTWHVQQVMSYSSCRSVNNIIMPRWAEPQTYMLVGSCVCVCVKAREREERVGRGLR